MISLLYSAGLRRQELLALRRAQIDFQQGTAFLDACKGDKDRVVLFDPHTLAQLDRYSAAMAPHQRIFPLSEYWGNNNFIRWPNYPKRRCCNSCSTQVNGNTAGDPAGIKCSAAIPQPLS